MDYTEEDLEKLLEKEKPPFSLYLKIFFLIGVISFGMLVLNNSVQKQRPESEKTTSKTLEAVLGMKDQVLGHEKVKNIADEVEKKGVLTALNTVKNDVQGETTNAAEKKLDQTTDSTVDYIYEKTIVQVIEKMIQNLPEKQREQFIEKMCRE